MVGEAGTRVDGEMVEHEERGEVAELRGADGAADSRSCAFGLFASEEYFVDGAWSCHVDGSGQGRGWNHSKA